MENEIKFRYQIGDKIKIKSNLKMNRKYGDDWFIQGMEGYEELTVIGYNLKRPGYKVAETYFNYTEKMIQ